MSISSNSSACSSGAAGAAGAASGGGGGGLRQHHGNNTTASTINSSQSYTGMAMRPQPPIASSSAYATDSSTGSVGGAPQMQTMQMLDDHRPDVELLHENMKGALDRTRQWYEAEMTKRDSYIAQLTGDFQHNLSVAQEQQHENERLRAEVDALNREVKAGEAQVTRLAETNGALTEQAARLRGELDASAREHDVALQTARNDAASSVRVAEAERARRQGEASAREEALEKEHATETQRLKQQREEVETMLKQRVESLEKERDGLEDKLSALERKLAATSTEKGAAQHSVTVSRRREEELEARIREATKRYDDSEMELSRLRDENISMTIERESRKSDFESALDTQGRSHVQRITQLTADVARLTASEKSLRDLTESLKGQLEDERKLRRQASDEADLRILQMRKQVEGAREAASDSANASQKETHVELRRVMEELSDQVAETMKQQRRADDFERKLQQAQFEASLQQQRIDTLSSELSVQRETFRADTQRIQQQHTEDAVRWSDDTAKFKRQLAASEEARTTLEHIISDHVDRERRDKMLLSDRDSLAQRVDDLEKENDKIRGVVRQMTEDMSMDPAIANARQLSDRVVSLEAELARAKNQSLELDVRLQAAEAELRDEKREGEVRRTQHAEVVKNLTTDAASLRNMLQAERQRKTMFVDATLAGVSKWTAQVAGGPGGAGPYETLGNRPQPPSVRSSYESNDASIDQLEADAAAATLADRLDSQALQHELQRLELVVSTQQKQLSELVAQRAQHVAQIADLKSMFEAVSQDRASLVEINNALRNEARAAEAEVARQRGEIVGLRTNLTRVRGHQAQQQERVRSPTKNATSPKNHTTMMMTSTVPASGAPSASSTSRAPLQEAVSTNATQQPGATAASSKRGSVSGSTLAIYGNGQQKPRASTASVGGGSNNNSNNNATVRRRGNMSVRNYGVMDE